MGNTFQYLIVGVAVSLALSFLVAYHLDRVRFGHAVLRALYFVPHITTAVAMGWVWRWLYQPVPIGVFNGLLVWAGLPQQPFLRSTEQALYAVLAPAVWAGLGFQVVIFLAGLKAIPHEYYEAAAIDGAGRWRTLVDVTLPLLRPTIVFLVVVELDRLPPHLRLRLQHDERPGRPARLDQAARPQDLRDRLRPLPDGLRRRPDGRPVRDPPGRSRWCSSGC